MGEAEISQFLTHLAVQKHVASSTQNQALCAILFLYQNVLKREVGKLQGLVWAQKPKRLPVVLSKEEVRGVLSQLSGTKWIMANLLYGSGLRLAECLRLRVKDIDFDYGQITVRNSKGNKDRVTVLPDKLKGPLKKHLHQVKKLHQEDLERGFGAVLLPFALERKYPNAIREFGWQYVFPSRNLSVDPGTKKLLQKYGQSLVCVRYRYDAETKRRITTVELIEEEGAWHRNTQYVPVNKIVGVRVHYGEVQLRRTIKAAGGRWNPNKKVWELPYRDVKELGLENRLAIKGN